MGDVIKFQSAWVLVLLWLVPCLAAVIWYGANQRRKALSRFAESNLLPKISNAVSFSRRRWKAAIILTTLVFLIFGLARPAWNPAPKIIQRTGRDVVFMLDVSRSMLAEDLYPNRLERAKLSILDTVSQLEGDRVGLVAFAGNAVVKCPLTLDYGFFRMMLDTISTESAARGGTMLGDALRKVRQEVFDDQEKMFKDIVLITDGEDHDSFPVEAAAELGDRGVRLIAIGIGDENQGHRIPVTDELGRKSFLTYNGQEVWSKLGGDTLRKMANATPGGRYLNVATGAIDLGAVYKKLVASAEKRELESKTVKLYEEKFQIFLGLALLLLLVEMLISDRRKEPKSELTA